MRVAVIDFETTGVDNQTCRPIEVGIAVTDNTFTEIFDSYSTLIYSEDYPEITSQIEGLTGICKSQVIQEGEHPLTVMEILKGVLDSNEVKMMVAFNADFDMGVFNNECKRQGFGDASIPWVCAMRDLESNYKFKCWKLSHLALDYGVPIDPSELHRAMADVYLTIDMLRYAKADAKEMYAFKREPWIIIEAVTLPPWKDGGKSTSLAKEKGFFWETPRGHFGGAKYPKKWVKAIREKELEKELSETLFKVRKVL